LNKLIAILIVVVFLALLVMCSKTYAQTNTVTSTSSTVSGTTTVDRTPSTASAPGVMINNQDVCSTGSSIAIQSQILGIAGGTTVRDMNCERLKLSRQLFRFGMKVAAVSMLCQDARVFQAMEMAGTPCPYMGLISGDAAEKWEENPEGRPDYAEWKKANVEETEFYNDDTIMGFSLGGLALLLLLF
tara:strand:- start:245 stop:805 length:561 start_codon:yes stop_codon:yes gene_type:complete